MLPHVLMLLGFAASEVEVEPPSSICLTATFSLSESFTATFSLSESFTATWQECG